MITNLKLTDGRTIQFLDAGAPRGEALVLHHGTPSEAGVWTIWEKTAYQLGVRLISVTRPGYGDSTGRTGRKIADIVFDIREVLDHLKINSFITLGWSGGGPHALACAALLGDRCRAAATLAGVAPHGVVGLNFLDGMGDENIREFAAAMKGEPALSDWMRNEGVGYRTITADSLYSAFGSLLSPVDQGAMTGELVNALAETIRLSLKNGFRGWIDDDLALVSPWGFNVEDISVPAVIWQGRLDKMVPFTHGQWLSERLKKCTAHLSSDEGHISLVAGRERDIIESLINIALDVAPTI